jgi:hypothetical protein
MSAIYLSRVFTVSQECFPSALPTSWVYTICHELLSNSLLGRELYFCLKKHAFKFWSAISPLRNHPKHKTQSSVMAGKDGGCYEI